MSFEARWFRWLPALILALSVAPLWAQDSGLLPLPEPALDGVEAAVREQLIERRASLAEVIGTAAAEDATLARAWGSLGQVYYAYEIMDAAEPCLLNARQLAPEQFSWRYLLGALYTRNGRAEEAVENLVAAAELRPHDVPTNLRLGRLYLDLARFDESEFHFSRALERDSRAAAAHHGLGRIAQERGNWLASLGYLETALELQPSASSIHYLIGIAHRELGDLNAARQHLRLNRHVPVLFGDPEVDRLDALIEGGRFYLQLGDLALGRGNTALAIRAFREAVARAPDEPLAHYNLGVSLAKTGDRPGGLRHLREAVRIDPEYRDAHFNLGMVLADADLVSEAETHFARALEIDPSDETARLAWARSLIWVGRGEEAKAALTRMLDEDPQSPEVLLALAEALSSLGRPDLAEARLRAVIENPREAALAARGHEYLSRLARSRGARSAAIEHLQAALRLDPRLPGAFESLGTLLGQEGRFLEAAVEFQRAVELDPRSLSPRFGQAMALLLGGQFEEARAALEESTGFLSQSLTLRHLLARVLATAPKAAVRDGGRALRLASEVYRSKESSEHAETVAMALAEVGDFERATRWQQRALALATAASARDLQSLQRRLELYQRAEPCRSPWLEGG